jgi:GNAT superfamily N-acetyltransferase
MVRPFSPNQLQYSRVPHIPWTVLPVSASVMADPSIGRGSARAGGGTVRPTTATAAKPVRIPFLVADIFPCPACARPSDHPGRTLLAGRGAPARIVLPIARASKPDTALRFSSPPIIRPATAGDLEPLRELQARSMRALGPGWYTPAEVEAAVRHVCVPDKGLIEDGTYLVAEQRDGRLVGCGGWSLRRKAYAGPADGTGDAERLDPCTEPTRIRAMFTAPEVARQGVGRAILAAAEEAARAAGFARARLGATLSGGRFYRRQGYAEFGRVIALLPDGTALAVILMEKRLIG